MKNSFIIGHEDLEKDFGYFPSFHDDYIEKIEINSKEVIITIETVCPPKGMTSYPKIKLIFGEIISFNLNGEIYGCVSIILDMIFNLNEDYVETELWSSLGTSGTIKSKTIRVEVESDNHDI